MSARGRWILAGTAIAVAGAVAWVAWRGGREGAPSTRRDVAIATGVDLTATAGAAEHGIVEKLRAATLGAAPAPGATPSPSAAGPAASNAAKGTIGTRWRGPCA